MEYFVHCNENAYNSLIIIIMYVERISFFFWNIWKWDFALRDIFSREITNAMIVFFKSRTIFICNKMIMFLLHQRQTYLNKHQRTKNWKENRRKALDEDIFNNKLIRFLVKMQKNLLQNKFNEFLMEMLRLFQSKGQHLFGQMWTLASAVWCMGKNVMLTT